MICAHCGESQLIEFDPITQRARCLTCTRSWPAVVAPPKP
jgi:hypothetical protein